AGEALGSRSQPGTATGARRVQASLERVTSAANETHADCLRIIVRAEMRMADEIDSAQERGEVARPDGSTHHRPAEGVHAPDTFTATLDDLGVPRQRLSEWRDVRDADPEVVSPAAGTLRQRVNAR